MAKTFKLPRKINGFRLPKKARKQANAFIARLQGEELEALATAVLGAILIHFADRAARNGEPGDPLSKRLIDAVGSHLKH
ncbi:hypothetical protein [Novosphingobium olei]|uniref:Uncharacterized protein n=1 Tax=Novosphingobium olei TaxID=2728851 RepID=A0A7Y0G9J6_9SPHN|nr:hypothetical protein [Novosphingobium olei]NML94266.1 hypothetical protein [Novosphingobium olei]BEV00774.1 hypothetical protein NSDW_18680 [Novosphingobium olei]